MFNLEIYGQCAVNKSDLNFWSRLSGGGNILV